MFTGKGLSQTSRLVHTKGKQLKIKKQKPIIKQSFKENAKLKQNGPYFRKGIENMNQLQISNGGLKKIQGYHTNIQNKPTV